MAKSKIEWTDTTWNPVTGCTKVSQGCKYCYAEVMAKRLQAMGVEKYKDAFEVRMHSEALDTPKKWRKPRMVFVNSMSDLFHESVPYNFFYKTFETMRECPQHVFQILTKRAERLFDVQNYFELEFESLWAANIWMGVSVEDRKHGIPRIHWLRHTNAHTKFLSIEPLLEDLGTLDLTGIDWVIVGGESGAKARPMKKAWVENIQQQCEAEDVPFFFKQWGGVNKKQAGRLLNGKTYDAMPYAYARSLEQKA